MKKSIDKKQMLLDFGQKNNGGLKQCKECEMVYNLDDEQDSELHSKYHKQYENILKYTSDKKKCDKIIHEYANIGRCIVIDGNMDSKLQITKAQNLLKYVDLQLGIRDASQILNDIENKLNESSSSPARVVTNTTRKINGDVATLTNATPNENKKYYLFISQSNRVIGFCLAEELHNEFKIRKLTSENDDINAHKHVICGISRIWVDKSHRRHKIATKLLDCVREDFIYYQILNLDQIAFSDPTENGKQLAKSYCKTSDFYIYFK